MANLAYADAALEIASTRDPLDNGAPGRNFIEDTADRYLFYDAASNLPHCVMRYVRAALDGENTIGPLLDLTTYGNRYGWTVARANDLIQQIKDTQHAAE